MTEAERSGAATSGSSTLTSRVRRASPPLVLVSHARFGEASARSRRLSRSARSAEGDGPVLQQFTRKLLKQLPVRVDDAMCLTYHFAHHRNAIGARLGDGIEH